MQTEFAPGQRVGPYEIIAPIAAGGMGEVWKARDTRLHRDVAIKTLPADGDRARFRNEARALAALSHPGIVPIYDVGDDYLVTELIDGVPLKAVTPRQAAELAAQVADALAAAHNLGIIHRDLKPANILLNRDHRTRLIDFGLVKRTFDSDATQTVSGAVMGTVAYMSPEQARGDSIDHRSDIFSLGVVLYEQLAGHRPFDGRTNSHTLTAILDKEPEELPESVPQGLRRIVQRCLEKDPAQRFQSARDLAFALANLTTSSSAAAAPSLRRFRWARTIPVSMLAGATIFIGLWPSPEISGNRLKITPLIQEDSSDVSPQFSPDGKSIAFYRLTGSKVDLLVRPLTAAHATIVVENVGNAEIVGVGGTIFWTQDSRQIYYRSSGLWRVSVAGGSPIRVLDEQWMSPTLMPSDGGLLVARRSAPDRFQLGVSVPLGADPKPLRELHIDAISELKFSPDGERLLIVGAVDQFWTLHWPSGEPKRIAAPNTSSSAGWFQDSRHVLFDSSADKGFIALDVESGETRTLHLHGANVSTAAINGDATAIAWAGGQPQADVVEFSIREKRLRPLAATTDDESSPSWTPDGRTLLYRRVRIEGRERVTALVAQDMQSGVSREFARIPTLGRLVFQAASPDGKRIAYVHNGKLWIVAISGGPPLELASVFLNRPPCWSPDGRWLAYSDAGMVMKVSSQGGESPITLAKGARPFAWSDAGIYSQDSDGLFRMSNEGTGRVGLGPVQGLLLGVSADGRSIYEFVENQSLLIIRSATTGAVNGNLSLFAEGGGRIRSIAVHPDGERLALYVARLPTSLWLLEGFPRPAVGLERLFRKWVEPSP